MGLRKCEKNYGNNLSSKQPISCRLHGAESLTHWRPETLAVHCRPSSVDCTGPVQPTGHYMYRTVVAIRTAQWSLYIPRSCHHMYRTVVTIYTASLTFNNSPFCPHSVFMCFVWIWEQTAIISLYSINWVVCITETESVYCAVRTERDLRHVWERIEMPSESWRGNLKETIRTT